MANEWISQHLVSCNNQNSLANKAQSALPARSARSTRSAVCVLAWPLQQPTLIIPSQRNVIKIYLNKSLTLRAEDVKALSTGRGRTGFSTHFKRLTAFCYPAYPACGRIGLIYLSKNSFHYSNSTILHSIINTEDLTYNTRDKFTCFYQGKVDLRHDWVYVEKVLTIVTLCNAINSTQQ